jgi:uncharacterized protein YecE (DUF72 family)
MLPWLLIANRSAMGKVMRRQDDFNLNTYHFRGLHPGVFMGTASDRYTGWIGQIYSEDLYQNRIISRSHKIGGKSFREKVLPVDSIREYFEHFRVVEVDYTFYQLLLDANGEPTQTYQVLQSYRNHLAHGDGVILKVPQQIFARKIRQSSGYAANERYLDRELFTHQFYAPATELLGSNLKGFVFEQEYHRKDERAPAQDLVRALAGFFGAIPRDPRFHVELRTESYLSQPFFALLEEMGIGQVLSHWTWLPPLLTQFAKSGRRFFNTGRESIIRLMTPLGVRYEDAYARAFPFTGLAEGMLQPRMIDETAALMEEGIRQNVRMNIIINNRAGGNAPHIAQLIARRFLATRSTNSPIPQFPNS